MNAGDTALVVGQSASGAEQVASKAASSRVVAAFGTVPSEVLFSIYERRHESNRPSLVYCGDDQEAKEVTTA